MEHLNHTSVNPYWDDRGHRNEGEDDEEDEEEEDEEHLGAMLHGTIAEMEADESDEDEEEYCIYCMGIHTNL